jgi:deoxyribonuclease-4
MKFGMHLTFSIGPQRAKELGCQALQIFCGNPRGWQKNPLDPEFVKKFRDDMKANGVGPLAVHATYLINLAARDDRLFKLSCDSFVMEVARAAQLGAQFYVVHIGNHMGAGADAGRKRVAHCIREAVKATPHGPEILVENTAGGGTSLGTTFEEVGAVIAEADCDRMGLCLDTCHALAAGYDFRTPAGAAKMLDTIDATIGLKRLRCLHLNDSKGELGSHLDRHEHIGKGQVGEAGFRALFSDKRVWDLPAILETPRDADDDELNDLWTAIKLAVDSGAVSADILNNKPGSAPPGAIRQKRAPKVAKPKAKPKPKAKAKAKVTAKVKMKKEKIKK